jgi:hypothetical protein
VIKASPTPESSDPIEAARAALASIPTPTPDATRELLAAIDEALDLPPSALTSEATLAHDRVLTGRLAAVRLALARVLVAGRDPADEIVDLRTAVRETPVTYPLMRGARERAAANARKGGAR